MEIFTVTEIQIEDTGYLRSPEDGIWPVAFKTQGEATKAVDETIEKILEYELPWEDKKDEAGDWILATDSVIRRCGAVEWHVTKVKVAI